MTRVMITERKQVPFTGNIRDYMTVDGYTKRSGAPTDYKVQIQGSNRWYRVYDYCTSNSGTLFIKTRTSSFTVIQNDWELMFL